MTEFRSRAFVRDNGCFGGILEVCVNLGEAKDKDGKRVFYCDHNFPKACAVQGYRKLMPIPRDWIRDLLKEQEYKLDESQMRRLTQ